MKRILFLSVMNGSAWGGSEEQWLSIAKDLSQSCRVDVCTFDWPERIKKLSELKKAGCRLFFLPRKQRGIFSVWKTKIILSRIPLKDYNLVYFNQGGWKDVAHGPFKSLYKKLPPYALTFHSYQTNADLPKSKVKILKEWVKNARLCIAASSAIYRILKYEYDIVPSPAIVFYSPISFDPPKKIIDDKKLSHPIFITLGSLDTATKAQDILIKVLGQDKWKDRQWTLNIYGKGKDNEYLNSLIKELSLENKVLLRGHTDDVKLAIMNSDLLIHVTHYDAMPISVIEAMALGKPCIVSPLGDMPEWVKPGINGFIANKTREKEIDEQLEIAWNLRDQWSKMGQKAFETFQEKYPFPYNEKFFRLLEKHF